MTLAILALLPALLALVIKIIERRWKRADDPKMRHEANQQAIDQALATGDSDHVNARLQSDLDRLQNARRDHPGGPGGGQA